MKLVDILARELKAWPGDCEAIEQDRRGLCLFKVNGPAIAAYVEARAEDAVIAKVTRAQWQAAVDALKDDKVVEWNGEGLPPVDTEIEWLDGEWLKVLVVGSHKGAVVAVDEKDPRRVFIGKSACYRPIRTPEQIAAEVRSNAIIDMMKISVGSHPDELKKLYDAGYRKFEIVDN